MSPATMPEPPSAPFARGSKDPDAVPLAAGSVESASDEAAARRRRTRWRARRGLLENDLVLERFFGRYEARLDDELARALDALLELGDGTLLDLILRRCELEGEAATPAARRVLEMLRSA